MYQVTISSKNWSFDNFFSRLPTLEEYRNNWRDFSQKYPYFQGAKEVCEVLKSCSIDPFSNAEKALCRDRDFQAGGETIWISFVKLDVINLP